MSDLFAQRSKQPPIDALAASVESLKAWRGCDGDTADIEKARAEMLELAERLLQNRSVDFIIEIRRVLAHATQGIATYAYAMEPADNVHERLADAMSWNKRMANVAYYASLVAAPELYEKNKTRLAVSGRFQAQPQPPTPPPPPEQG